MRRFSWLTKLVRQLSPRSIRRHRRRQMTSVTPAVCRVERLEPRVMLSASPVGSETQVNATTTDSQFTSVTGQGGNVAMDAEGDYVVVWTSANQDGGGYGVYAQRYNSGGVAEGTEFLVNSTVSNDQLNPAVAMDAAGDFVVTWTSAGQDGSGYGVYAQRYNAAAVAQGNEFLVNTTTLGDQQSSTVAMDAAGNFVVTWSSYGQDGDGWGVYAQRYDESGVALGSEIQVNATTAGNQLYSTIAMDAAGDFVVTWSSSGQDTDGYGVYAQRFNSAGIAQGSEFLVNETTTGDQRYSNVAMDSAGNFVVTWSSYGQDGDGFGVYARQYDSTGTAAGGEFQVNTTTAGDQFVSTVAMDAAGDYAISWTSYGQEGADLGIYARQYSAAGVALGGEEHVNSTTADNQSFSSIAMDATGDFVVAWQSYGQDGSNYGVYTQRYQQPADTAGPIVAQVFDGNQQINPGDLLVTVVPTLTVVFSEDLNVTGGATGVKSVTNPANWQVTQNGVDVTSNVSSITFGLNPITNKYEAVLTFLTPLSNGSIQLTAKQSIQDLAGNSLDGDLNGAPGGDFTQSFAIAQLVPAGGETQVNTTTSGDQYTNNTGQAGAVAMDASGNYVVVWQSGSGGSFDIYGQRYTADGAAVGSEFLVNTNTAGSQKFGTVAMDAAGDFVVTWSDYSALDGSLSGVYAQRYDSSGAAQGSNFLVNTQTAGNQAYSSVAMDSTGDFVVTWTSYNQDQAGTFGVFAQRYDATGAAIGGEFQVNTTTTNTQAYSTVAMDAGGDFVITWSSNQSGSDYDIYAQRFNAAGAAQGTEFRVNSTTTSDQRLSTVAMDAAGDFVVTWSSYGQDGSSMGVYAQRYDETGVAQGAEFQVNTYTTSDQTSSAVAMNATGDFIVTWQSVWQDGSGYGIYARGYSADGVAQGPEVQVNTTTDDSQAWVSVAADPQGDVAVVWSSFGQDGNGWGVYSQLIQADISPTLSLIESTALAYTSGNPAAAITSTLNLVDPDTANMVGAVITIDGGYQSGDLLSFADTATITGTWDEPSHTLTLTGSDSVSVYQAALQSITFSSSSLIAGGRSVSFQVSDGQLPSNLQSRTVDVSVLNTAPLLSNIETTPLPYPPASAAVAVTSSLQLSDPDIGPMSGATIQITGHYVSGADVLAFTDTPNIQGSWNANTGTLTLTGSDSVANYEAALRSVTYQSTSQDPTARTVSFQVDDGTDLSNVASRDVGGLTQLVGTTLNVYGTPLVDVIDVSEDASLVIVVDGISFSYTPAQVTAINIYAGDSNDTVQINSLANGTALLAFGGKGNDTLRTAATVTQAVTLVGQEGNDLLIGGAGNDGLSGGDGDDWLNGGDGNDDLSAGAGNDVYAFNDTLTNQTDTVWEYAGATEGAADLLNFSAMTVAVTVNLTSDTALATTAHRIVRVGAAGQSANFENVNGGSANDFITGNTANNVVYGNGGNDTLSGGDGSDHLDGGSGNDLLKGGNQDDVLVGGIGDDYLKGEAGQDFLDGGDGYNTLVGGVGDDKYVFRDATVNQIDTVVELTDEGNDTLDFTSLTTAVVANLTSDTTLATMNHRIVWTGGSGQAANFENVNGGAANDQITGNAADNLLRGNGGNDTLTGGAGNDILVGGDGNDTLKGISGRNILIGGTGADLLLGGTGEDILLAGSVSYASSNVGLQALLSEWVQVTSYQSRLEHLQGITPGGANGGYVLNPSSVSDDSGADYLTGSTGQDWYLANSTQDVITDKAVDEVFTHIDSWI